MLDMTVRNTRKLVREKVKSDGVRMGRFFTKKETARLMASFVTVPDKPSVRVLDPGAGTGILSAAVIERLCASGTCREIDLVCYENDAVMIPRLKENLERLRRRCRRGWGVRLVANVMEENYILAGRAAYTLSLFAEEPTPYDIVIMNPPSELVAPDAPEALAVKDLFAGSVDLTYLFLAMAQNALARGGQLITLLPTAFATSPGLARLRRHLFSVNVPTRIHLFTTGKFDKPLKKTMILAVRHTQPKAEDTVTLSSSADDGTPEKTVVLDPQPLSVILRGDERSLLLMYDPVELQLFSYMTSLPMTLSSYGLGIHTGLTLVSRYRNCLYDAPGDGLVPLITPAAFRDGRIQFPALAPGGRTPVGGQYLAPVLPGLTQKNRNMLLIKRAPARADKRRLVCAVWMSSQLHGCERISTHNKVNFIVPRGEGDMDAAFVWGLYCFLSSTLCDIYVRILSKSGQINAGELSEIALPAPDVIRKLGNRLFALSACDPDTCDRAIHDVLRISIKN